METIMSKWSSAFRDSRWQRKRLEIMERDKWTCQSCGASGDGVTLNVHHAYYVSGKAPWEYDDESLTTWCETCHNYRHEKMQSLNDTLAGLTLDQFDSCFELIALAWRDPAFIPTTIPIALSIQAAISAARLVGYDNGKRTAAKRLAGEAEAKP